MAHHFRLLFLHNDCVPLFGAFPVPKRYLPEDIFPICTLVFKGRLHFDGNVLAVQVIQKCLECSVDPYGSPDQPSSQNSLISYSLSSASCRIKLRINILWLDMLLLSPSSMPRPSSSESLKYIATTFIQTTLPAFHSYTSVLPRYAFPGTHGSFLSGNRPFLWSVPLYLSASAGNALPLSTSPVPSPCLSAFLPDTFPVFPVPTGAHPAPF